MTIEQLAKELSKMYENADKGEKVANIHLFAIRYAKELSLDGISPKAVLRNGGTMPKTYERQQAKYTNTIRLKAAKYRLPYIGGLRWIFLMILKNGFC